MDLAKIRKKAKGKSGGSSKSRKTKGKSPAKKPVPVKEQEVPESEVALEQKAEPKAKSKKKTESKTREHPLSKADIVPEELAAVAVGNGPQIDETTLPVTEEKSGDVHGGALPDESEKLLIFRLGKQKYAIPIHDVAQIIDERPVTPVPNAPSFLKGIVSLRGKIVTVVDVAERLGLRQSGAGEGRKLIILDIGSDHYGLLVDAIEHLVMVNIKVLEPTPEGFKPVAQDFVEGLFHHDHKAVAFMNLPLFLTFTS